VYLPRTHPETNGIKTSDSRQSTNCQSYARVIWIISVAVDVTEQPNLNIPRELGQ